MSLFLSTLASCGRSASKTVSVSIQIPSATELKKISAFTSGAQLDVSKLCFGVNIKNKNKPLPPAKSCDIERGLIAGTVQPGESITFAEVESGPGYEFELYAVYRDSASQPCPSILNKWNAPLNKVYILGSSTGVELKPPTTQVTIVYQVPDASQNIVVQKSWPSSCLFQTNTKRDYGRIVTASGLLSSNGYRLYSKMSSLNDQTIGSTNFKIKSGKVGN